jgi:ABC-type sugar transport system ATPase subunit
MADITLHRLALARAIAYAPQVVLFDEPLSNLDAKLRDEMRDELKALHREVGVTAVYVTHDQAEVETNISIQPASMLSRCCR